MWSRKKKSGAARRRPERKQPARQRQEKPKRNNTAVPVYFIRHAQVAIASLGKVLRGFSGNLLTMLVIGIALSLPTGLFVVLDNLQVVSGGWEGKPKLSLFLVRQYDEDKREQLLDSLRGRTYIDHVEYISPESAMQEFKTLSGFGDAIDTLPENPLPAVITIEPAFDTSRPGQLENLREELSAHPIVEIAQLDMAWVHRLFAMMETGKRAAFVLAGLLAFAVLFIVGNTIRLEIQNHRDEIEITKLIGGTDTFIRRPFLYTGTWHGVFGGCIAWILVDSSLWSLHGPIQQLSGLYHSDFELIKLGLLDLPILMLTGGFLGLAGAWIAVTRHLSEIEPA